MTRFPHGVVAAALGGLLLAACSSSPSLPPADPVPLPETAPPSSHAMSPRALSGTYRLRTAIQRQGGQRGRRVAPATTSLTLGQQPVAAPDPSGPATQFGATVSVPGYTRAPRGRAGQAAVWFPIGGDSVVVQFTSAAQPDAQIQLRGASARGTLRGDVWFVSASGATFQLGTFVATRGR